MEAAALIADVVADAGDEPPCSGPNACEAFIGKWSADVPDAHVARLNQLLASANALLDQSYAELVRVRPLRNAWMLRKSRRYADPGRFDMGFAGALHIPGMQKLARKTPLITMVERGLWEVTLKLLAQQEKSARFKS